MCIHLETHISRILMEHAGQGTCFQVQHCLPYHGRYKNNLKWIEVAFSVYYSMHAHVHAYNTCTCVCMLTVHVYNIHHYVMYLDS